MPSQTVLLRSKQQLPGRRSGLWGVSPAAWPAEAAALRPESQAFVTGMFVSRDAGDVIPGTRPERLRCRARVPGRRRTTISLPLSSGRGRQHTVDSGGKGFCLLTTSFWCWCEI